MDTLSRFRQRLTDAFSKYGTHAVGNAVCGLGMVALFVLNMGANEAHFAQKYIVSVGDTASGSLATDGKDTASGSTGKDRAAIPTEKKNVSAPGDLRPAATEQIDRKAAVASTDAITIATDSASLPVTVSRTLTGVTFPDFGHAVFPVSKTPNWGAMRTPGEWDRSYKKMKDEDFVAVPAYDLETLTIPLEKLIRPLKPEHEPLITAKLFYSTRFFGTYDLDSGEFEAVHPGIDIKLARGTPVGAVAGGRVRSSSRDATLGIHVIIEHFAPDKKTYFSLYGHLESTAVKAGDDVVPGQYIGNVGVTGSTTGPHLHFQIDRKADDEDYVRYWPKKLPTRSEADRRTVHPISFINMFSE